MHAMGLLLVRLIPLALHLVASSYSPRARPHSRRMGITLVTDILLRVLQVMRLPRHQLNQ